MSRRRWTPEEDATLRELYPHLRSVEVAERLGRPVTSVIHRARALGIVKDPDFLASHASGRLQPGERRSVETEFAPGLTPWNKGTRGVCGHHPNTRATQFRPGSVQGRARELLQPIGATRVVAGYLLRKVNDDLPRQRRWKAVHVLVWEEAHGPVPPGHVVAFLPGRRTTVETEIRPECLELVTRAEMMRRNSFHTGLPDEVKCLVYAKGQLTRKINALERSSHEK